jgi:hypothetical protein
MPLFARALAPLVLAIFPAALAHADVIYARQFQITEYLSNTLSSKPFPDHLKLTFGAGAKSLTPTVLLATSILDDSEVSAANVGRSWTSSAATDPDFASIAALLANGTEDKTYVAVEGYHGTDGADFFRGATIYFEGGFFAPRGTTDLAGYEISTITVTLDAFRIDENYAPNPANPTDTGWKYFVDYTLSFQTVPEPAALACLVSLVLPAVLRRPRRR